MGGWWTGNRTLSCNGLGKTLKLSRQNLEPSNIVYSYVEASRQLNDSIVLMCVYIPIVCDCLSENLPSSLLPVF